jgi:hypothetical protein
VTEKGAVGGKAFREIAVGEDTYKAVIGKHTYKAAQAAIGKDTYKAAQAGIGKDTYKAAQEAAGLGVGRIREREVIRNVKEPEGAIRFVKPSFS